MKPSKGSFGSTIEVEHLPRTNEKHGVGSLGRCFVGTKANDMISKLFGLELLIQFFTKSVKLSQVERSKVKKEVPVDKLRVDTEEVNGFVFNLSVGVCCCECMIRARLCFQGGIV